MSFMWTFEGVIQAIGLSIVILFFSLLGLILLIDKIERWFRKGKK